jgi:anti-sigma B factor antagonist
VNDDTTKPQRVALRPTPRDDIAHLVGSTPPVPRDHAQLVVWLCGEHDMSTATSVTNVLADITAASDGNLVVDLSQVEFMDARIINALIHSRNVLRTRSRDLTLQAPSSVARRILSLCGLLGLIDPGPPIDTGAPDACATVPGIWSRAPLGGRAVQAIPRIAPLGP